MDLSDAIQFVNEHKLWFAVATPFVVGFILMKFLS